MAGRCEIDASIERQAVDGFAFPLGVYPVEAMSPIAGYSVAFEQADGDDGPGPGDGVDRPGNSGDDDEFGGLDGGSLEAWPDRYVYEITISAERLGALCRSLFMMLPARVYPILEFLGHDEYREVDPYVSYELIGLDRFLETARRFRDFLYEDGLVGFGALSEEPFFYVFVDEHKIVTVRCEPGRREEVERVLSAFDLEEVPSISGADAATHEHRTVLLTPEDRTDLLNAEEIVEDLQDEWGLILNIDPTTNVDEQGNELGVTPWRCLVRAEPRLDAPPTRSDATVTSVYAEVLVTAANFDRAEELAISAVEGLPTPPELERFVRDDPDDAGGEGETALGSRPASAPGPTGGGARRGAVHRREEADEGAAGPAEGDEPDFEPPDGRREDHESGLLFTLVSADRTSRSAFREMLPRASVDRVQWTSERMYRAAWL